MNVSKVDLPFHLVGQKKAMSLIDNLRVLHRLSNSNLEAMNRFRIEEIFECDDGKIRVTLSGRLRVAHDVFRPLTYDTRIVCQRPHYAAARATVHTAGETYEWLATARLLRDGGDVLQLGSLAEERALDGALRMAGIGIDYPGEVSNFDWEEVRYFDDVCGV